MIPADPSARREALLLLALALIALGYAVARQGTAGAAGWLGLVAMLPLARRAAAGVGPPRFPWPAVPLAHLPIAMLFACGQLVIATGFCRLLDLPTPELLPEVRRSLVFYAATISAVLVARRGSAGR